MNDLIAELRRRNVIRAGILYVGAVWALAQGISQLSPAFGAPEWFTRGFVIAAAIGFPFWLAFTWFYEWTPEGLKRESEVAPGESITRHTGRKLDFAIIAVLAVAVVLLLTDRFMVRKIDKSIAVLPLVNSSDDPANEYFSDGLSEELINTLGRLGDLTVIGRTSSFQFKGKTGDSRAIAAKLGVEYLLEGSVRKAADHVRIAVELVRASNGANLWSESYDREMKDIFQVQTEIASAIATHLHSTLAAADGTGPARQLKPDAPPGGSVEAYTAYLQGEFFAQRDNEADDRKAIEQYTRATAIDPRYARAWAKLALISALVGGEFLAGAEQAQIYAKAEAASAKALELAPDIAAVHVARGRVLTTAMLDWRGAETEMRRAATLAPDDGDIKHYLARTLATLGQMQEASRLMRESLVADPLNAGWYGWLGVFERSLGRFDDARAASTKSIELQPAEVSIRTDLSVTEIMRGNAAAALAAAQQEPSELWRDIAVAFALQIGGDRAAADAALQRVIEHPGAIFQVAEIYALRNEKDKTFEWLERARAGRDPGLEALLYDPFILRYRDDPRFAPFCNSVGLPSATDAKAMP
jgi:TolB-like protein/Flp pilus assembly protein TadD